MENLRNRIDVKLVNNEKDCLKLQWCRARDLFGS